MTESFALDQVNAAMTRIAAALRAGADHLTELDQKVGDGDLGITARKAADALDAHVATGAGGDDLGAHIAAAGMAINRVASSTMGTLLATAGMRAGRIVKGADTIQRAQLGEMLQAAADGMQQRGKANPGDKTILDALFPAAKALQAALAEGQDLNSAGAAMVAAAARGRDAVTPQRNKIGRASWVGERTEGAVDPGCELCVIVLAGMAGQEES